MKVEDPYNNVVTNSSAQVTLAINTYSAGNGGSTKGQISTCAANPLTANSGVAAFTGCQITGTAAAGTYTFSAAASGFSAVSSTGTVTIIAGPATKLVITTQPSSTENSGAALAQQPTVTVEDANSNVETNVNSGTATASINSGSGGSIAGGGTSGSFSSGVASFGGLALNGVNATVYTLTFIGDTLNSVASSGITMATGAATHLAVTTQPVAGSSGAVLTTEPVIKVEDSGNNVVTTDIQTVTLTPSGGSLSSCSSLTAVSGVISVANCSFAATVGTSYTLSAQTTTTPTLTGTSGAFTPSTFGTAAELVITTQPSSTENSGAGLAQQPVVKVEDSAGNVVTNVNSGTALASIAFGSGGSIAAGGTSSTFSAGVASFTGLTLNGVTGNVYTLTFGGDGFISVPSSSITMATGAATQLVFTTQPAGSVNEGVAFTQPAVTVEDSGGNTVTSSTAQITLSVNTYSAANGGSAQGSVSACTANPLTPAGGVATFTGCQITGTAAAGTYTLRANATGVGTANSSGTINVTAGSATAMVFTTQPIAAASGALFSTQPVIKVEDSVGNVVTSDTQTITLNTSGGTLSSCSGLMATGGVFNLSGCTFAGTVGTSYTLSANTTTPPTLSATSGAFSTTTFGTATQVVLSGSTTNLGSNAARTFTATIEDGAGNTITSGADSADAMTFSKTTGSGSVAGLNAVTASAGVATDTVTGNVPGTVTIKAAGTVHGNSTSSNTATFTVDAAPTVISPTATNTCNPGHDGTANCTITGTGFINGATVTISANGTVNSVSFSSSTSLTINVTGNGGNKATGNITVTNPDGGSVTVTNGFSNGP
ncbi:MAG TPA: hypothetical protein VG435_11520 [Acidimicrobiales bacterium]|nr:hypothetical protein [Acidimicrobiales bacterium]